MIYLVHGDDIVKSRSQIINQQKKINTQNKLEVSLEEISITELSTHTKATSLFGEIAFIIVDITNTKGTEEYIEVFKNKNKDTIVILYSEKTLTKTNVFIKNADKLGARIIENKIEHNENIFKFVDALFSKNRGIAYKEYEKLIKAETDPFYIFTMILYGLRNITKGYYKAPSFEKGTPYNKSKTSGQLRNFNESDIKNLYDKVYLLEKGLKGGEIQPDMCISMAIENVLNSK